MSDLPPLTALRSFEAVARLGSISQAASELHVTHSAISQQIKLLAHRARSSPALPCAPPNPGRSGASVPAWRNRSTDC